MVKKILLTGSNGQLGRALQTLLRDADADLFCTDADTLDICDANAVRTFFEEKRPDTVINCAAYTAVDACETNKDTAYRINAVGPKNLAQSAAAIGAQLVQVSTDYVFDGAGNRPYLETDETAPQSVYGSTKLAGEREAMAACTACYVVRTAWLYGDGNNFVRTMLRLARERDTVTVVNDQYGAPTSALELARAILYIIEHGKYGIYHATCEGSVSWYEFAASIFELAGVTVNLLPVTTQEYTAAVAKRPAYSVLENRALQEIGYRMKDWKDALQEYLTGELA